MKNDLIALLNELTLDEKASLCSGSDFWHLKGVERLNIPSIMVTDGPHGLRKQEGDSDHVGLAQSVPATCFPTASATASSWDIELLEEMGVALGEECLQEDVAVLLGPGANIKRSPLCGRNFEYISEDPYLTGQLGAALVNGIQSMGIGTSLKHFAANNQEYRRMVTESVVDERTFREIYLAGFENIVKEAQPWTVMCAYNKLQGIYCSDNNRLLTDILKEEWGHTGLVMTDWGACSDRVKGIKAGMELEMPASGGLNDSKIVDAINKGILTMEELDKVVLRLLKLIKKSEDNRKVDFVYNKEDHHQLARKIAGESAVLLKNKDNILPLAKDESYVILGAFAKNPRYQGAGSSLINPYKIDDVLSELESYEVDYSYAAGYELKTDEVNQEVNQELINEAIELVKENQKVIVFAGLTDNYESEGFDRKHIRIPTNQLKLIEAVSSISNQIIVVLQNGAPIEMPWIQDVSAILESYLGGQSGAGAAIDILFGKVNPSGKLAETFPLKLEDDLASHWFANSKLTVEYRESIYVGYRYYDSADKQVLFPFGHGLSYTSFEYNDLSMDSLAISDNDCLNISFKVKNIGQIAGSEVIQLYVKDVASTIYRPEKELKRFDKIFLLPNEEKIVTFTLDKRAFAYYNININDWHVESGGFEILIGASSRDIKLSNVILVEGDNNVQVPNYRETAPEYYEIEKVVGKISGNSFKTILGRTIPAAKAGLMAEYTINSTLGDVKNTFIGKKIHKMVEDNFLKMLDGVPEDDTTAVMMKAMVNEMPLRSMVLMGGGMLDFTTAEGLIAMMNGKYLRGGLKIAFNKIASINWEFK